MTLRLLATALLAMGAGGCGGGAHGAAGGAGGVAGGAGGAAGADAGRADGPGAAGAAGSGDGGAGAGGSDAGGSDGGGSDALVAGVLDAAGGTVTGLSGAITIEIPAGALLGETTFFVSAGQPPPASPDYTVVPDASFRIEWTGAGFAPDARIGARVQLVATAASGPSGGADPPPCGGKLGIIHCGDGSNGYYADSSDDPCGNDNGYDSGQVILPCNSGNGGKGGSSGGGHGGSHGGGGGGDNIAMDFDIVLVNPTAPPAITAQPQPTRACRIGDTVSFSVTATGAAPLSYKWFQGTTVIDGWPSSPSYTTGVFAALDGTKYSVVVSNDYGKVTSASATLSVLPPAPLAWGPPAPLGSSFAAGVDAPAVGNLDGYPIVVWNDGGTLRGAPGSGSTGAFTPIATLALPVRGRPKLPLAGRFAPVGCVVFVDDDGTGGCPAGSGNRLSAVALGTSDDGPFPLSDRFTLYPPPSSTGACIASFSAAQTNAADVTRSFEVVFALVEAGTRQIRTGEAEAAFHVTSPAGQPPQGSWTWTPADVLPLAPGDGCDGPALLGSDGMAKAGSEVLLAWAAGGNVCSARTVAISPASTSGVGGWSQSMAVFDRASGEPVAGLDAAVNALVVADRAPDPTNATATYEVTAAFQPASGTAWSLRVLDTPAAPSTVTAAFDGSRSAYVAWMPNLASGPRAVYAAVRAADTTTLSNGTWGPAQRISGASAVEVREPRICIADYGIALALYAETDAAGAPLQVVGNRWFGGGWSLPGAVQTGTNAGRVPDCATQPNEAVWRETSPTDPAAFRIVEASGPDPASTECGAGGSGGATCAQGTATTVELAVSRAYPSQGRSSLITAGPDGRPWFTFPDQPPRAFVGSVDAQGGVAELSINFSDIGDITAGPGGDLWLTGYASGHYWVVALTTQGTVANMFQVADGDGPIAAGPDGNLWFGGTAHAIYRMSSSTGTVTRFDIPIQAAPQSIVAGPDGNVWLTDGLVLVSVTPAGAPQVLTPPATASLGTMVSDLAAGPDGNVWFTESNASQGFIGRLTLPGTFKEFPVCSIPFNITAGGDGNLWYTTSSFVGRITPAGTVTEFAGNFLPLDITAAGGGRDLWLVQGSGLTGSILKVTAP